MMSLTRLSILFTILLFPALSQASNVDKADLLITGGISYYPDFDDSAAKEGIGTSVDVGYAISPKWLVSMRYSYFEIDTPSALPISGSSDVFRLGLMYAFTETHSVKPFLSLNIGLADEISFTSDVDENEFRDKQLGLGGGLLYSLTDNLALRGDLHLTYSFEYQEAKPTALLGVTYRFD
ncbi:outer membrane beta-barrel protein [Glaciecola siphonariae]|uniref:Outer membrane beta-barrel protein n=1 Tax=Glaciecola siphonariae TaxID=521012 RepID=A0ABV9LSV2_9ALTE